MQLLKILIYLIILTVPVAGWGSELVYVLDVRIDPSAERLFGSANIYGRLVNETRLSVRNLSNIRVNGKRTAAAADDTILVKVEKNRPTVVQYEAVFDGPSAGMPDGIIDKENVFLMGGWYPVPQGMTQYTLSVTLPRDFTAVSEAERIEVAHSDNLSTHLFHFDYPLDGLHLAASSNYRVKKDRYNDIVIESYFFREDAALADTYIEHAKQYLELYETLLTPYPYKRFAIVENILPTGYALPTFTLLGREVVRLPFIVKTSLAHEILHQWFGNYVYIDHAHGNWAEGLTSYLSDYFLEENRGAAATTVNRSW